MLTTLRRFACLPLARENDALKRDAEAYRAEVAGLSSQLNSLVAALDDDTRRKDGNIAFLQNMLGAAVLQQHREELTISPEMFAAAEACGRINVGEDTEGNFVVNFHEPDAGDTD